MASTYSDLKFELIGTGDQSGTWGTTTNTNLGTAIEQALVGMATISSGFTGSPLTLTLTLTDTNAAQNARALCLNLTQALGSAGTLNVPAIQKPYMIINATGQTVTVKVSGLTGVAVPTGTRTFLYNNGTDVGDFVNYLSSLTLGTDLAVADGGTGSSTAAGARTNLGATTAGGNLFTLTNPSAITFLRINADNTVSALSAADFRTAIGAGTGGGSVTQVATSGTVNGITLTGGPITTTGTVTLGGTLSGVSLTTQVTGTLPVGNGGTGITSGTSGGVPYFSASNTIASSSALAANALVIGGGAGVAPSTTTTGSGILTFLGTPSSANLAAAVTDETGSGSLVFATSPALTTPNLGTPSAATLTNATGLPLTTGVTGTLPVGNGGTGAGTFTANNVLLGNGTSAFQVVAPGTSGNVLTSNGTTWTSSTPAGGALTNNTRQAVTSASTTTIDLNSGNVIDLTMAANITSLSFTNVPASGTPILIQIVVKNASNGTAYTITWPSSVYWSGQYAATTIGTVQTAPTLATGANGVTVIALLTTDGGTKWRGWVEATIPGGSQNSLYSWGTNGDGKLGLNNTTGQSSPVQVGALTNWLSSSLGANFSIAVKTDGTLWSWGSSSFGQLGQNSTTSLSSPVQIGALTDWSSASARSYSCTAIKTNGTLWSWGRNEHGQLGQNSQTNISSPTQVGALTDWASTSSGETFCTAVKTNGTLWSWGRGSYGRLGQNNEIYRSSPTQIGALTDWASTSSGNRFCIARKTNGTLWSWGFSGDGALGTNQGAITMSSPVQIGALTDWSSISSGATFCIAIKTDGTLWSWGSNGSGQLGQSNVTTASSPVQVGALTSWSSSSGGNVHSTAVKTDGTLWAWGLGSFGQLGQNSTASLSSPVQVGVLTWGSASAGLSATIAVQTTTSNPA